MNYKVKIGERIFEVEIPDIHTRPILAIVDGETIEVWPENGHNGRPTTSTPATKTTKKTSVAPAAQAPSTPASVIDGSANVVYAPIPGVVISVAVKPGAEVSAGQELLVLEAMKMKNTIRAARSGTIAAVNITPGQTVQHHDVLMEFEVECKV